MSVVLHIDTSSCSIISLELASFQQTRFNRLSDNILDRVDTMGSKIDQLEKSINELIDEAGIETTNVAKKGDAGK